MTSPTQRAARSEAFKKWKDEYLGGNVIDTNAGNMLWDCWKAAQATPQSPAPTPAAHEALVIYLESQITSGRVAEIELTDELYTLIAAGREALVLPSAALPEGLREEIAKIVFNGTTDGIGFDEIPEGFRAQSYRVTDRILAALAPPPAVPAPAQGQKFAPDTFILDNKNKDGDAAFRAYHKLPQEGSKPSAATGHAEMEKYLRAKGWQYLFDQTMCWVDCAHGGHDWYATIEQAYKIEKVRETNPCSDNDCKCRGPIPEPTPSPGDKP